MHEATDLGYLLNLNNARQVLTQAADAQLAQFIVQVGLIGGLGKGKLGFKTFHGGLHFGKYYLQCHWLGIT